MNRYLFNIIRQHNASVCQSHQNYSSCCVFDEMCVLFVAEETFLKSLSDRRGSTATSFLDPTGRNSNKSHKSHRVQIGVYQKSDKGECTSISIAPTASSEISMAFTEFGFFEDFAFLCSCLILPYPLKLLIAPLFISQQIFVARVVRTCSQRVSVT